MKTVLLICVLCACGGSEKKGEPGSASPAAPSAQPSLEDTSLKWVRAALGGRRAEALALSLTHAEFSSLTTKTIEKADYDEELGSFLDGLGREGSENAAIKVVATRVAEKKTMPAGEKLKRETEIAMVYLVIEEPTGERHDTGMPMFFIRTDAGWRFSPRK
jgi:hypothetical protein